MEMKKKPPLGIMSRHIWNYKVKEQRLKDLLAAMQRFEDAGVEIPTEWYKEYVDLTTELRLFNSERSDQE